MTDVRRISGGGPLSSFRNIIMTRSAKVRDLCITSTKQKYQQNGVEPEMLQQNNTNLLRERTQYDMFRAKSMGGKLDTSITETNNNSQRTNNNRHTTMDSKKTKQIDRSDSQISNKSQDNDCNNTTKSVFKQIVTKNIKSDRKDTSIYLLSEPKAKPNIYETVPRHRTNQQPDMLDNVQNIDNSTAEVKRKPKSIYSTQTIDMTHRPQTPKIKKSVEMRNNLRLLNSNAAAIEIAKSKFDSKDIVKKGAPDVSGTNHERRLVPRKKSPRYKAKESKEESKVELRPQLLHPLWRRIPHRALYGWSDQHQLLENLLHKQMAENPRLTSPYYASEESFTLDQEASGVRFLQRPIVGSVAEALTLLQYYEACPGTLPKTQPPRLKGGKEEDEGSSEDVESGYDGDDE